MSSPAVDSPSNTYVEDDSMPPMENDYDDNMMSSEEVFATPEPTPEETRKEKKKEEEKDKQETSIKESSKDHAKEEETSHGNANTVHGKTGSDTEHDRGEGTWLSRDGLRRSKRQRWKPLQYVVCEREAREFQLFSHFHVSITSEEYHSHCSLMLQRNHSKSNARM